MPPDDKKSKTELIGELEALRKRVADLEESRPNPAASTPTQSASEAFLRVVQSMPVLFDAFDEQGRIVFWNRECERVTGYSSDEIVGNPDALALLYPDPLYREHVVASIRKAMGDFRDLEFMLTCKSGRTRTIAWSNISTARPIPGWATWAVGFEVTTRADFEQRLRAERHRLTTVLESIPAFVYLWAPDYSVRYANERFTKLFGDPKGKRCYQVVYGREQPCPHCRASQVHESGTPLSREWTRQDGRTFMIHNVPFVDTDGSPLVLEFGIEITDRKQVEEELRLANAVLSAQQEASLDGILVVDKAGRMISFNHRFAEMWSIPADVLDTQSDERALECAIKRVADPEAFLAKVKYLYEHPQERSQDRILLNDDVTFDRYSVPIFGPGGEYYGRVWFFCDVTTHQQAEQQLLREHRELRQVLDAVNAQIWYLDMEGRVVTCSRFAETVSGVSCEQAQGKTIHELAPGWDDPDRRHEQSLEVARTGQSLLGSIESFQVNSEVRWVRVDKVPWRDADAKTIGVVVFIYDITDLKRTEKSLLAEQEFIRALLEQMADGVVACDAEGKLVLFNRVARQWHGMDPMSIPQEQWAAYYNLYHADGVTPLSIDTVPLSQAFRGETLHDVDLFIQAKGQPPRRIFANAGPIYDQQGHKLGAVTVMRDVTESLRAQEALLETTHKLQALIEASPFGVICLDREGKVTLWSPAAERMFGWKEAEVLGQFNPIVPADAHDSFFARYRRVLEGNAYAGDEVRRLRQDGSSIDLSVGTAPLRNAKGDIIGAVGILADITARKKAEAERRAIESQMQQAQKLESLGVLAGGIAHDFNNLLVAVLGNADLALMDLEPDAPARQSIEQIEVAARRAADLCRQMLAYSGKGRFFIQSISLNDLINEMTRLLEVTISRRAALRYHLADSLPPIEGDATQIRQIIMNLVTNASEALSGTNGVISIGTGSMHCTTEYLRGIFLIDELTEGTYVWLEVTDTGQGMDKATMDKIFEPFFTTKFAGRGLGLAAVMGIVRSHKGALKVYSEIGKGTTFKILLPAVNRPAEPLPEEPDDKTGWKGSGTVLLVDDEETVRTVGKRMIEKLGFEVLTAVDGQECIDVFIANRDRIVCVVLDLIMPRMDGEETYRSLRQIHPEVRVILSSGYSEQEAINRFAGKKLAGFIQKPYQTAELAARLRTALQTPKSAE